jgi:hypothetical protein
MLEFLACILIDLEIMFFQVGIINNNFISSMKKVCTILDELLNLLISFSVADDARK